MQNFGATLAACNPGPGQTKLFNFGWGSRLTMEGKRRWGEGNLVVRENADRLMRHVTAAVAGGFAASGKWHHGEARQEVRAQAEGEGAWRVQFPYFVAVNYK